MSSSVGYSKGTNSEASKGINKTTNPIDTMYCLGIYDSRHLYE